MVSLHEQIDRFGKLSPRWKTALILSGVFIVCAVVVTVFLIGAEYGDWKATQRIRTPW